MSLVVNEIFYSIQGESTYAGLPCVFVRLTGCNLRCSYCDTEYAYSEGRTLAVEQILARVATYGCSLVEITGGEPLIQKETPTLISALLDHNYSVLLETNGSRNIGNIDEHCVKIVDFKCPSSGESHQNDLGNLERLAEHDEIKFVIGTREDYDYAKRIIEMIHLDPFRSNQVLLSPVFGKLEPKRLAGWILDDHLNARLQLQLHKLLWGPDQRGV